MVDEQKNVSPDDEYQFPQEEYIASGEAEPSQQTVDEAQVEVNKSGNKIFVIFNNLTPILMRNKRIVIIILAILLVLLFLHFSEKKAVVVQPVEQPQPTVTTVVQQPDAAMTNSLNSLQANTSQTSSDIKTLQSQVSDLQNALTQSQTDNTQLRNAVNALAEQMKEVTIELDTLTARKQPPLITYHLRAVIPDRAWITSGTQTRSVTIGDEVRTYGKVTAIYSQQGFVETSSGRKIKYGPNDR